MQKVGLYIRLLVPSGRWQMVSAIDPKGRPLPPGAGLYKGKALNGGGQYYLRYGGGRFVAAGRSLDAALAKKYRLESGRSQPAPEPTGDLQGAIEDYLHAKEQRAHGTWLKYRNALRRFRQFCTDEGVYSVADIGRPVMLRYIRWLQLPERGLAPRSVHNELCNVCAFLKRRGAPRVLYPEDWPQYEAPEPDEYSSDDLTRLLAASSAEEALLWRYFNATGCRDGEVAHVEWSDLDLDPAAPTLHVARKPHRHWKPKRGKQRYIPLDPALAADLARRKVLLQASPGDLVFPAKLGGVSRHFLRTFKRCARRAGLDPATATLQKFRRTFISRAVMADVDIPTLLMWVGHEEFTTTIKHYVAKRNAKAASDQSKMRRISTI